MAGRAVPLIQPRGTVHVGRAMVSPAVQGTSRFLRMLEARREWRPRPFAMVSLRHRLLPAGVGEAPASPLGLNISLTIRLEYQHMWGMKAHQTWWHPAPGLVRNIPSKYPRDATSPSLRPDPAVRPVEWAWPAVPSQPLLAPAQGRGATAPRLLHYPPLSFKPQSLSQRNEVWRSGAVPRAEVGGSNSPRELTEPVALAQLRSGRSLAAGASTSVVSRGARTLFGQADGKGPAASPSPAARSGMPTTWQWQGSRLPIRAVLRQLWTESGDGAERFLTRSAVLRLRVHYEVTRRESYERVGRSTQRERFLTSEAAALNPLPPRDLLVRRPAPDSLAAAQALQRSHLMPHGRAQLPRSSAVGAPVPPEGVVPRGGPLTPCGSAQLPRSSPVNGLAPPSADKDASRRPSHSQRDQARAAPVRLQGLPLGTMSMLRLVHQHGVGSLLPRSLVRHHPAPSPVMPVQVWRATVAEPSVRFNPRPPATEARSAARPGPSRLPPGAAAALFPLHVAEGGVTARLLPARATAPHGQADPAPSVAFPVRWKAPELLRWLERPAQRASAPAIAVRQSLGRRADPEKAHSHGEAKSVPLQVINPPARFISEDGAREPNRLPGQAAAVPQRDVFLQGRALTLGEMGRSSLRRSAAERMTGPRFASGPGGQPVTVLRGAALVLFRREALTSSPGADDLPVFMPLRPAHAPARENRGPAALPPVRLVHVAPSSQGQASGQSRSAAPASRPLETITAALPRETVDHGTRPGRATKPAPELRAIADRVYDVLVERVRQERRARGG
jgi:hypothetical protein